MNIGYSKSWSSGYSAPLLDDVEITTNTNLGPTTVIAKLDACYPSGTTDFTLSANYSIIRYRRRTEEISKSGKRTRNNLDAKSNANNIYTINGQRIAI